MKTRLLYMLFLLASVGVSVGASAQNMPERGEVRRGNRLYNKGSYEKSIERYQNALQYAPSLFEATYNMGNALYKAERYDQAEKIMAQAAADTLRTAGERAEAFYNLGNAQFKQEKYKEALESYKQSLRLNPSDMEAKYNYAYTKRLLDDNQQGGGGNDQNKDQNQQDQQDQNQDQQQDQQKNQDQQDQNQDQKDQQQSQDQKESQSGISPQQQEQMLDAIQAQEDRTQEKLKEKQGAVVQGNKNW